MRYRGVGHYKHPHREKEMGKSRQKDKGFGQKKLRQYKINSIIRQLKDHINNNGNQITLFITDERFFPELQEAVQILYKHPKYGDYLCLCPVYRNEFLEKIMESHPSLAKSVLECHPDNIIMPIIPPSLQEKIS